MNEQASDSELLESIERLLEQLEHAIDARLPLARRDRIEADRLFVFAGEIDAALHAASSHLRRVRSELESIARDAS